jgi:glyoxylase-like metal-dependent hydrolase (beta-lactamase superfamily II)
MDGLTTDSIRGRLTCHCLLIESRAGLILIDTGYGLRDVADPESRLSKFFLALVKPELREEMTAIRQIERLGLNPRDVRHIVLSHLDFDHAGGLDDFPHASVHMLAQEEASATAQETVLDRMRYRPQQWHTRDMWRTYTSGQGEPWYGFDCVREMPGVDADVLLVPLIGHTLGHAGVAVKRERDWLFYTADAYFYHAEMDVDRPRCTPGLRLYQTMMEKNRAMRLANQKRLRELARAHGDEVRIFCAHDVVEFERIAGRSHREPIGPSLHSADGGALDRSVSGAPPIGAGAW